MESKSIVFIHGMYMNSLCWEKWLPYFQTKGYTCVAPDWPGRDKPVNVLRQNHPDQTLGKLTLSDVLEHVTTVIQSLKEKPILIGHSMGGLVTQLLLQQGLASTTIAIYSAPPAGVFTAKWSFIKANWPHANPFVAKSQPVQLSFEQFQYAFVNGLPLEEQRAAYDRYAVPESRHVPAESLGKTAKIDFAKARGPLLLIAGEIDHIIPASLNRSNYEKYKSSSSVTDFKEFAGRNHFILGQQNWEEVADYCLAWLDEKNV